MQDLEEIRQQILNLVSSEMMLKEKVMAPDKNNNFSEKTKFTKVNPQDWGKAMSSTQGREARYRVRKMVKRIRELAFEARQLTLFLDSKYGKKKH